jgi:hypothetical protein
VQGRVRQRSRERRARSHRRAALAFGGHHLHVLGARLFDVGAEPAGRRDRRPHDALGHLVDGDGGGERTGDVAQRALLQRAVAKLAGLPARLDAEHGHGHGRGQGHHGQEQADQGLPSRLGLREARRRFLPSPEAAVQSGRQLEDGVHAALLVGEIGQGIRASDLALHDLADGLPPAPERGSQLGGQGREVGAGQLAGDGVERAVGVFRGAPVLVREAGVAGERPGAKGQDFPRESQPERMQLVAHRGHPLRHVALQAGRPSRHRPGQDGQAEQGKDDQAERNPGVPLRPRAVAQAARGLRRVREWAGGQPTRTVSIETDPPSIPSTGKLTGSSSRRRPSTYSSGR